MSGGVKKKKKGKDKVEKVLPKQVADTSTKKRELDQEAQSSSNKVQKTGGTEVVETAAPEFKDLTKQAIRTRNSLPEEGGRASLASATLLMSTGSVDELLGGGEQWTQLAAKLKDAFKSYDADDYAQLCTIYHVHGKEPLVKREKDAKQLEDEHGSVEAVADFLTVFMARNGQLEYVKNSEWFTSGEYAVGIDVNYYPDRSGEQQYPKFHKDTGGNNLFVNLIFDNEQEIEATEWFVDLAEAGVGRTTWQRALLPASHVNDLEQARDVLRGDGRYKQSDNVVGGTSPGPRTYVSWVDDLVWHSSPGASRRFEYNADAALAAYQRLAEAAKQGSNLTLSFRDPTLDEQIPGVELLGSIMDVPGTHLSKWFEQKKLGPSDVDAHGRTAWRELYTGPEGVKRYQDDMKARAAGSKAWHLTGVLSEANAADPRLPGGVSITETPPTLSTRRRANSLDENQPALLRAREANEGTPRSFIRTWVRILSRGSKEAKNAGINT